MAAMPPIDYIPRTREMYPEYLPYRWVVSENAPWTPLTKPLTLCRVALVSSGGVYHREQQPFHIKDDTSWREIPKDVAVSDLRVSHFGYLTDDARRDANCVFPLERLRELEKEGLFGELSSPAYSFMGGIYSSRRVREEVAPWLVESLHKNEVEVLFLVPA